MGAPISILGGEYKKNDEAYTSSPGTVENGDTLKLRGTSSDAYETEIEVTVTVGEYSTPFSVTTKVEIIPPVCPDRVLVFQICNSNEVIDDNFDVYLNDVLIGTVDLNANALIGSVFIASNDTPTIVSADFICPLVDMDVYYFDPALVLGENEIKMVNVQNNGNGNAGSIQVRNYLLTGSDLSAPCVVDDFAYSGASGSNFEFPFIYTACCPEDE